jgi:uncharacterized membrane protein YhaH (DUF805 family)
MGLLNFLFGFKGRTGRLAYGIGTTAPWIVGFAWLLAFGDFGASMEQAKTGQMPQIGLSTIVLIVCFLAISFWSWIALGVKRLHDLNCSGWMLLAPVSADFAAGILMAVSPGFGMIATVAAFIFSFWQMIRLIFVSGTSGDNDFGSPPDTLRDVFGGTDLPEKEPEWVANAVKRTTAKAQAAAAATSTPVTRVVRVAKLPPAACTFGTPNPAGFGRRNR